MMIKKIVATAERPVKKLKKVWQSTIDDLVMNEKFGKIFQILQIIHETVEKSGEKFIVDVGNLSLSLRCKRSSISRERNNNTRMEAFSTFVANLPTVGINLLSDSDMQQYIRETRNTNR